MNSFQLPKNFLMGTATASCQIEGNETNHNWYRWCQQNKIKDGSSCIVSGDHWNRYKEDISLMKEINSDIYRMSLEWSRIEPQEGVFNKKALLRYREELQALINAGIKPLVTLHHFSNPIWFEDIDGFENPNSIKYFVRYTKVVMEHLGDMVSDWVTINEPNVYLESTYISSVFPHGKSGMSAYLKAAKHLIISHIKSYKLIHQMRKEQGFCDTLVGTAHHLTIFEVQGKNPFTKLSRNLIDRCFHQIFLEGMINGKIIFPLGKKCYPSGKGTYSDFIGINYYTRHIVKPTANPASFFGKITDKEDVEVNDLGWEIYPEGLYQVCKNTYDQYKLPIFITENGICDEQDSKRSKFIYDHLKQIEKLINHGIDVQRYYHWSLIDNFEWDYGLSVRFGLIHVDYETQKRTIRNSGKFYGEICKSKKITDDMIERYL